MALAEDDIEKIQQLIDLTWAKNKQSSNDNIHYELDIRERIVRVEEELKNQRELILKGFQQSDKRFEEIQHNMDKRFEEAQHNMDKRFEQVDKRFEQVDKRFEQVDKQFTEMGKRMDRFMFWSLGITISVGLFVVTYLK